MTLTRRQSLSALMAGGVTAFASETHGATASAAGARMTLLLVNDVYQTEPGSQGRGGFARLAAVVATERRRAAAEGRRLVFVHAGDTLSPSLLSSFDEGAHMIALFNRLGLDVFVPGNHEFDFGAEVYGRRIAEARFAVLAANLRGAEGAPLPGHRDGIVLSLSGFRIAILGAAYDHTGELSHPDGLRFAPTVATVERAAATARAEGADFVVAVIHADRADGEALMLSHAADVVLSGHNHDLHIDFDGRTAFAESSQDANFVTAIDLDLARKTDADGVSRVVWWPTYRITDTVTFTPDSDMAAEVTRLNAALSSELGVVLAHLTRPLDSRRTLVRTQETAIGNLFADAMRRAGDADVAILNGGAIRGNREYEVGAALTRGDVLGELPFVNKLVVTRVRGDALLRAFENGVSGLGRETGRFPQVSGVTLEVARDAPVGSRLRRVAIGATALRPEQFYRVATNDFMARGGDGYGMLAGDTKVTIDSGTRLVSRVVMDDVTARGAVSATVEGRIKIG